MKLIPLFLSLLMIIGLTACDSSSKVSPPFLPAIGLNGQWLSESGNMYIADAYNCVIRKVDQSTGIITTVAGMGDSCDDSGDGAAATSAQLAYPTDVAVDADENMYIADSGNCKVRKVDHATGFISTVAGTGSCGFSGDGAAATAAQISGYLSLTINDAGDIYIADSSNCRIRMVSATTGFIETLAGTASCGFSGDDGLATAAQISYPTAIALDASENVYFAGTNNRIRKINTATGIITTVVGTGDVGNTGDGGLATSAEIGNVFGLSLDSDGNLYFSNTNWQTIRKVSKEDNIINTIAGQSGTPGYDGDGADAALSIIDYPDRIALDALGSIFFYDSNNYVVRKIDAVTNTISTVAGSGDSGFSGDGGAATDAELDDIGLNHYWD